MIFIRRCCFLTRSFYSPHQSTTFNDHSIFTLAKKCNWPRTSSSLTTTEQESEAQSTATDSEVDRKLKLIHLEISLISEHGGKAPDTDLIKKHQWNELLSLESKSARRKYYTYLFSRERTIKNNVIKRQQKKEAGVDQHTLELQQKNNGHITYNLCNTSLLLRVDSKTMNSWRNNRLVRAMQFGEKLIFDCSYDEHMTNREAKNAASQLTLAFAANRMNAEPFDVHYCNVNFNSETMKQMERRIPVMRDKGFPMNLHEESYLDLFPKNQLVYLTPHCDNVLNEYDPNMIYIVGAMVDKVNKEELSLGKAKELNLNMARLPLDTHLQWGCGAKKSLTLDQMMRIMLDLKKTQDWQVALKHVPRRKLMDNQNNQQRSKFETFLNKTKKFS